MNSISYKGSSKDTDVIKLALNEYLNVSLTNYTKEQNENANKWAHHILRKLENYETEFDINEFKIMYQSLFSLKEDIEKSLDYPSVKEATKHIDTINTLCDFFESSIDSFYESK